MNTQYVSIGDLEMHKRYLINYLERVDTQYGPAIKASLERENKNVDVFLPKSLHINDDEISSYYTGDEEMYLVYKDKNKRRFIIEFH